MERLINTLVLRNAEEFELIDGVSEAIKLLIL